jgi:hypothetical protein
MGGRGGSEFMDYGPNLHADTEKLVMGGRSSARISYYYHGDGVGAAEEAGNAHWASATCDAMFVGF